MSNVSCEPSGAGRLTAKQNCYVNWNWMLSSIPIAQTLGIARHIKAAPKPWQWQNMKLKDERQIAAYACGLLNKRFTSCEVSLSGWR
jgi:hypothetical protein